MNMINIYQYPLSKVLTPTNPAPTPAKNDPNPSSLFRSHLIPHFISLSVKVDELKNSTMVNVSLLKDLKNCSFPFNKALMLFMN